MPLTLAQPLRIAALGGGLPPCELSAAARRHIATTAGAPTATYWEWQERLTGRNDDESKPVVRILGWCFVRAVAGRRSRCPKVATARWSRVIGKPMSIY